MASSTRPHRTSGWLNPSARWHAFRAHRKSPETPKTVVEASVRKAISRNLIHLLPMTVLTGLVWINYTHYYIGPTFIMNPEKNNLFLAGIQLCAKVEELLCVASLGAIILHALRAELLGDGLPIGLLGSGIWFSSLSAFWSPEFRAAFSWKPFSHKRARFFALLTVCGLLAVTIGPASAYLMSLRNRNVPVGGTSFVLPGSAEQYWPDTVSASTEPSVCSSANATQWAFCPSGGYSSLSRSLIPYVYGDCSFYGQSYSPNCQAHGAESNRNWISFLIQSPGNNIPSVMNSFRGPMHASSGYSVTQPHAATVVKMYQLRDRAMENTKRYKSVQDRQYQWAYDVETLGSATSPYVRTQCTPGQNLTANSETAEFRYLVRRYDTTRPNSTYDQVSDWSFDTRTANISQLTRGPSSSIRTQWIALPGDNFGIPSASISASGLLIELPWTDNGSRIGIGCSVTAAWHNTTVRSRRATSYSAFSVAMTMFDYLDHNDSPDFDRTNKPVRLDKSWLDMLTPASPISNQDSDEAPLNTFERILNESHISRAPFERLLDCKIDAGLLANLTGTEKWNYDAGDCDSAKRNAIAPTVGLLVADGLSRYASHRVFDVLTAWDPARRFGWQEPRTFNETRIFAATDDTLPTAAPPDGSPTAWLTLDILGYAYYPNTKTDYFALAAVCVYLAVALTHIIYSLITMRRRKFGTSTSWESVTELLVLCLNSPPPDPSHALDNTSGGIKQRRTYKQLVKVRAFPPEDGASAAKLRLVLEEDAVSMDEPSTLRAPSSSSSLREKGSPTAMADIDLGPIIPASVASSRALLLSSSISTPQAIMLQATSWRANSVHDNASKDNASQAYFPQAGLATSRTNHSQTSTLQSTATQASPLSGTASQRPRLEKIQIDRKYA